MPSVLFVMADYGHDPTETAIPYRAFKEAKYDISFATKRRKAAAMRHKNVDGLDAEATWCYYRRMCCS